MATHQHSRKRRQQLWLPIAGAAPLGVNPALLQQIQTSTTSSLNTINAQGATQNALAQRATGLQTYTGLALGNVVGSIGLGATPLSITGTNFGGTSGGGGGGGGAGAAGGG